MLKLITKRKTKKPLTCVLCGKPLKPIIGLAQRRLWGVWGQGHLFLECKNVNCKIWGIAKKKVIRGKDNEAFWRGYHKGYFRGVLDSEWGQVKSEELLKDKC